MVLQFIRRSTI